MSDLKQTWHEDADGTMHVRTYQDVEGHLEYCSQVRRAEREAIGRTGKTGDLHRKMSIPMNVILMVAQRLGIPQGQIFDKEYSKRIYQELQSPEFAYFRTTERAIG